MEKEKFGKKLENFWYYYKVHVFVSFCVVGALLYMYMTWVPIKQGDLNIVIVGNKVNQDEKEKLIANASEDLGYTIKIDNWLASDGLASGRHPELQGKLMAMIEVNDVDIVVMDHDAFQLYAMHGNFLKLDDEVDRFSEGTINVKATVKDEEQEVILGVQMDGNEQLKKISFYTNDKILAIVRGSERQELALQWVEWILEGH